MKRVLLKSLFALVCALAVTMSGSTGAMADVRTAAVAPSIGVIFTPTGSGQCGGPGHHFSPPGDFTTPIRIDTDNRPGGCMLAFAVDAQPGTVDGLELLVSWRAEVGANVSQCGNQGIHNVPVTNFQQFSPRLFIDTDNRRGGCILTFILRGRIDVQLDAQWWADDDATQCKNALPPGQWHSTGTSGLISLGFDTDNRFGGCNLALRLRHV